MNCDQETRKAWLIEYDALTDPYVEGNPETFTERSDRLVYVFLNPHVPFTIDDDGMVIFASDDDHVHFIMTRSAPEAKDEPSKPLSITISQAIGVNTYTMNFPATKIGRIK